MTSFLVAAAFDVVPALRFGRVRLTVYGLCAAVGLMLAVALARRCARRVDIDPERAWDVGLFAIVSCFLASRLLLVVFDLKSFLRYPLLVLSLPSLTYTGMAIAAVMVWVYLRRRRIPVLLTLDVFAAPGAVLAAFLELGNFLDGAEVGMPTKLPWAVLDPWSPGELFVHPVALYGVVSALGLGAVLWWLLSRRRVLAGRVAALGLMLGGLAAFCLDMLTLPVPAIVDLGIEPGQWVALVAIVAGALLWTFAPARDSNGLRAGKGAELSRVDAVESELAVEPWHTEVH